MLSDKILNNENGIYSESDSDLDDALATSTPCSRIKMDKFYDALIEFIVVTNQPLSLVD